eukprot:6206162-Pleurochrysis_carterae.AAC.1
MNFGVNYINGKRQRDENEQYETAWDLQEQEESSTIAPYALRPLYETAARPARAPATSTAPPRLGTLAAQEPVTVVHSDLGVRITAPPRTAASMPVPIATDPVGPQLAFSDMSPQLGAKRPTVPDGQ